MFSSRLEKGYIELPTWIRKWIDFQFLTIYKKIKKHAERAKPRRILDYGAGSSPWRVLFQEKDRAYNARDDLGGQVAKLLRYDTLDLHVKAKYKNVSEIPEHERHYEVVLLIEVLEHASNPEALLMELHQLEFSELWLSVPFAARVHAAPNDYQRWTRQGLELLLQKTSFEIVFMEERGSDTLTLLSKVILYFCRRGILWLPLSLVLCPLFVLLGHLSLCFGFGNNDDPLGYFVVAKPLRLKK